MIRIALAVARHPTLYPVAVRQWRRTVPSGWWRQAPFLPVPSREYLRFRMLTQYGDTEASASGADVVNYLAWCREMAGSERSERAAPTRRARASGAAMGSGGAAPGV